MRGRPGWAAGVILAWVVQTAAFWRLDRALVAGRDATRTWLGGIAARFGGLVFAAGLALGGVTSDDVPVAYGVGMLVLLLMEAVWLARRPHTKVPLVDSAGAENDIDRTRSTG